MMCICAVGKVKLLWLAGTDAVVHLQYMDLLQAEWDNVLLWTRCSEACVLLKLTDGQAIACLLEKLLSNHHAPESVVSWVLAKSPPSLLEQV
jgi:hypothetical protein